MKDDCFYCGAESFHSPKCPVFFEQNLAEKDKRIAELEDKIKKYDNGIKSYQEICDTKDKEISDLKKENEELTINLNFEKQTYDELSAKLKIKSPEAEHSLDTHKGHFFVGCKGCEYEIGNLIDQKLASRAKEWVGKIDDVASHVNAIIVGLQNDIECGELDENIEHNLNEMNKIVDKLNKFKSEMGVKE